VGGMASDMLRTIFISTCENRPESRKSSGIRKEGHDYDCCYF
jgi:hypothetical protein